MNWVTDFLTPLIKWIVFIVMIGWCVYLFYWAVIKNRKLWFKYKVLRRKYDERVVAWCMEANELDYTVDKVKEVLLLKGHQPKKAEEIAYIYAQVRKMKGGLKQDEQRIRESDLKTLPEIKDESGGESEGKKRS